TFLQKSAKSSGVDVRLWESGSGSQLALFPNLNANDEEWRKLMRDVRFRRAALGIGLGLAACPLSQPQRQRRGMAQADARRALPPRAVAGHRPQRAERGRLYG